MVLQKIYEAIEPLTLEKFTENIESVLMPQIWINTQNKAKVLKLKNFIASKVFWKIINYFYTQQIDLLRYSKHKFSVVTKSLVGIAIVSTESTGFLQKVNG